MRLTRVDDDTHPTTGCPEHGSSCSGPASPCPERDPWAGNADWRHGSAGDVYLRAGISPINASSPPPTHFCSQSVIDRPPKTASVQRSGSPVKPNSPTLTRTRLAHRSGPSWTSPCPRSSDGTEAAIECHQEQPSSSLGRCSQHGASQPLTPCSAPMEAARRRLVSECARGDLRSLRAASQALLQLQAHEEQAMRAELAQLSEYVAQLELSVAVRDEQHPNSNPHPNPHPNPQPATPNPQPPTEPGARWRAVAAAARSSQG